MTDQRNFDFAIFKNTKFGADDRYGLEFRARILQWIQSPAIRSAEYRLLYRLPALVK